MPNLATISYFLLVGTCLIGAFGWIWHLLHLARHRRKALFLAGLGDAPPEGGWPTLAVIFAARDEAPHVEAAARSMLGLDYPGLEVIAVDDRSVDATGAILDAIARDDPRLRVVHVRELPDGWLGKTHALQVASESTSAAWLLFTDADVVFRPGALRKAVGFAERERVDHVTIGPEVPTESAGERLFLGLFELIFGMNSPLGKLDDRNSKAHAGIGAFNLVRAGAFRAIGGFRRLALSVDDDMRLGQALKFAGYKMRLLLGKDAISVRRQAGLWGMVRGLEKNFFAAVGFSLARTLVVVAGLVTLGIGPYVGLFVGPGWSRAVCGLGVASIALILLAGSRHNRIGPVYALLVPISTVVLLVALARSTILTLSRGGVLWRGHLYPLAELKRHVRLRDAWTREVWRSTR